MDKFKYFLFLLLMTCISCLTSCTCSGDKDDDSFTISNDLVKININSDKGTCSFIDNGCVSGQENAKECGFRSLLTQFIRISSVSNFVSILIQLFSGQPSGESQEDSRHHGQRREVRQNHRPHIARQKRCLQHRDVISGRDDVRDPLDRSRHAPDVK